MNRLIKIISVVSLLIFTLTSTPLHAFGQDDVACQTDAVVQADDWLSKLAEKFYGDALAFPVIAEATNLKADVDDSYSAIENVDVIEPGWKLCIPFAQKAESLLSGKSPVSGGHLTLGFETTLEDTGDLHKADSWHSIFLVGHIVDTLVDKNPKDGQIYPDLAESWEFSDDGLELTLHLRDDVTFHDGTPFNADAAVFNFNRICNDPEAEGHKAWAVLGCDEYFDRVEKVDEYTIKLVYKKLYAPLLDKLTLFETGMHSPTAIEEYGDDYGSKIVVGTGPFKWVEWTGPNGIFTAERNDDYNWAPVFYNHQGPPYLDGFTWKGILEVSTRSAAVESGDVDIATVAEKDIPRFNSLDGFKVEPLPRGNLVFQINFDSPILADLRVREALSHAIDRQAIIDSAIYAGFGEPANSVLTPRVWGDLSEFDQYNRFYDPDKANALLEEAGWIDSDGDGIREANGVEGVEDGTPLVLKDVVLVELLPLAEILQGMFLEVGIKTELEVNQFDIWYNNREEGNFDISLHTQDPGDLFYLQPYYATDGTENDGDYQNPDIDAQYAIALGTTDVDVQRAAIRQVQIDILEDLAFIPVISPVWPWAMKEGVNSLDVDTFGIGLYLYDTWIDPNP